jgi:regulator of sirC expression with transglutaminase-like and TPR domain
MKRSQLIPLAAIIVSWAFIWPAFADEASYYKMKADTEALFHLKGDFVDLKIAIDKFVDPTIDERALLKRFNDYLAPLPLMMQGAANDHQRLKTLRHFLFDAGQWNEYRVLRYDFSDPFGHDSRHRFLSYTLNEKLGNCSTMASTMFLIGRKMGLKMTLSILPRHVFIKFTDEQNRTWNIEATSGGGYTRDNYYREQFQFSEKAVESGAYMSTLTDEQALALMAQFIPDSLMAQGKPEEAIAAYSVILQHFPTNPYAWLGRGSSYGMVLRRDFLSKYESVSQMSPEQKQTVLDLSNMNKDDFDQAEALGWNESDDLKSAIQSAAKEQKQLR